jgi:hypothetical protein
VLKHRALREKNKSRDKIQLVPAFFYVEIEKLEFVGRARASPVFVSAPQINVKGAQARAVLVWQVGDEA